MEAEFVYWRHPSTPGIKVEEVSGGDIYSGEVWRDMARQIYCENGKEAYREIGHFSSGVPFLYGENNRISISHCDGLYVVATLPPTPEVNLGEYSERAALGVDAERADRAQVINIRQRFLNDSELTYTSEDVEKNVLAWTIKEAAYKAAMAAGLDFRTQISIIKFPRIAPMPIMVNPKDFGLDSKTKELPEEYFGEVKVVVDDDIRIFKVFTYLSDECIVTLCYSPRCAKFGKSANNP